MDSIVVIIFIIAVFIGWIAWLVYNYAIFNKQVAIESKVNYWKNRVTRVQDCLKDLVKSIRKQFPKSTINYYHTDEIDEIGGEIKY